MCVSVNVCMSTCVRVYVCACVSQAKVEVLKHKGTRAKDKKDFTAVRAVSREGVELTKLLEALHTKLTAMAQVVLQCVAVCCNVLQCVAVCCSVLQCVAVCGSVLQCVAVCCNMLQCGAVCCSMLQRVALCCSVLQRVAGCCSVVQCVAAWCSVLQCASYEVDCAGAGSVCM